LDIDRLFVQQLGKGLDSAMFHRYIANSMTNQFQAMVQFGKRFVLGHRFSLEKDSYQGIASAWERFVSGHRFSDAAKATILNGFSRRHLPVTAQSE